MKTSIGEFRQLSDPRARREARWELPLLNGHSIIVRDHKDKSWSLVYYDTDDVNQAPTYLNTLNRGDLGKVINTFISWARRERRIDLLIELGKAPPPWWDRVSV